MSAGPANEGKGLAFMTGRCVGSVVRTVRRVLPGSGPRGSDPNRLREGMLKALLELCADSIDNEPDTGKRKDIDGVLEKARGIRRAILASRPRGRRAKIHVGDIAAMDGLDGSKVSERAIRMNRCSIARFGLLNPLVVRQAGRGFQLLLGYARHEGCRRLGLGKVPSVVRDVEGVEAVELALLDILLGNGANHLESDCLKAVMRFYTGL